MTRRETVLAFALAVVVAGGGYALAATTTAPAEAPAGASTTTAPDGTTPATGTPWPAATGMPAEAATGYSNNQLATSIAQQVGTQLAPDSPMYVPASQVQAMASAVPPEAREAGSTITPTPTRPAAGR